MGSGGTALLLLPLLISGFLFNIIFYPLRYFSSRSEGQKLFFMAAGSGLFIGALVFLITGSVKVWPAFQGSFVQFIAHRIDAFVPVPHACRLIVMLLVAVCFAWLLNIGLWLIYGRKNQPTAKRVYNKLTDRYGNPLCQLLRKAAEEQKLVMLTLKSRKIYCGRVLEVPSDIESEDAFVELLPSFSAYRDKDTLRMGKERTEYPVIALWEAGQYLSSLEELLHELEGVYELPGFGTMNMELDRMLGQLHKDIEEARAVVAQFGPDINVDPVNWIKVIGIKEIESASFYDAEAYGAWFGGEAPGNPPAREPQLA